MYRKHQELRQILLVASSLSLSPASLLRALITMCLDLQNYLSQPGLACGTSSLLRVKWERLWGCGKPFGRARQAGVLRFAVSPSLLSDSASNCWRELTSHHMSMRILANP